MAEYNCSPLDTEEIHLLALQPGLPDDPCVRANIIHVPRYQPPDYEALSYCWGKSPIRHAIQLYEKLFEVGDNLSSALKNMRGKPSGSERLLWANAICINQHDFSEKSTQVILMGSVYQKCFQSCDMAWGDSRLPEARERKRGDYAFV